MGIQRTTRKVDEQADRANVVHRAFNSIMSARNLLSQRLGEMFNGRRNLYETFGYADVVTYEAMLRRYERLGLVSRIVNAYPDAIWGRPPQLIEGTGATAAPGKIQKAVYEIDKAVGLYHYINRADRLSGIGKYSVLLLGLDDVKNNEELSLPVRGSPGLAYVQAFGYGSCTIQEYEDNMASPHYGMPRIYGLGLRLNLNQEAVNATQYIRVHRDRVIHICDNPLDNDIIGYPIIERVYNSLDDVEKTVGGSAEMFWLNGRHGLHIDVDKETKFTEANAADLRQQIDDFMNDLTRVIRTRGVSVKDMGATTVNPEPVFNVVMSMISIATGIPQRIFIGSEQGKLASEQDRANWAVRVNERRVLYAEPRILRPLIVRLQKLGIVPSGEFDLQWPEAFIMSPLERGQTAAQQARAATNMVRSMQEYAKPIEGVDYAISRPTSTSSGGTSFNAKGNSVPANGDDTISRTKQRKLPVVDDKEVTPKDDKEAKGNGGDNDVSGVKTPTPTPVAPVRVPNEEIKVKRRELVTPDEARRIIFANGTLKGEGSIDGVPD